MNKTTVDRNENKWGRLLAASECQAYLGAGRSSMIKITTAAGAKIKVGTRTLYDRTKIDSYLDSLTEGNANEF